MFSKSYICNTTKNMKQLFLKVPKKHQHLMTLTINFIIMVLGLQLYFYTNKTVEKIFFQNT